MMYSGKLLDNSKSFADYKIPTGNQVFTWLMCLHNNWYNVLNYCALLTTRPFIFSIFSIALYMHKDYSECRHTLPTYYMYASILFTRACRKTSDANESARSHTPTHVPTRYVYIVCTRTQVSLCALQRCCDQVLFICILFVNTFFRPSCIFNQLPLQRKLQSKRPRQNLQNSRDAVLFYELEGLQVIFLGRGDK